MARRIRLVGLAKLNDALLERAGLDAVRRVVQKNGDQLNRRMKDQTSVSFTKGYSKGHTRGSINTNITNGGLTAEVEPTMDYDPYVEYGTRFMEAEPFVRPAWEEQTRQFQSDMRKLTR